MKKMLLFLPAVLLALFISGCGKNPDAEIQSKIPDSANVLCLVDGNYVVQTRFYKENWESVFKKMKKDDGLSEEFFTSRVLFFASFKEESGGLVFQSKEGQAAKLFDRVLAKCKENSKFKDVKETANDGVRCINALLDGKPITVALFNENLLLAAVNRTDLAHYKSTKGNPLFKEIRWKNSVLSAAFKVDLPEQGKGMDAANTAIQMIPCLQKLTFVSLNVPFAEQDQEVDFRMIFADEAAAGEMLATVNMGMGFVAQESPELNTALLRKTEKNAVLFSFKINEMIKVGKTIQAKKEKKERARAAKLKKKKAQAGKKQAAKPAAQPAPVKTVPAEAQKPADQPEQPKAEKPAAKPAVPAQPVPAAKPAQDKAAK